MSNCEQIQKTWSLIAETVKESIKKSDDLSRNVKIIAVSKKQMTERMNCISSFGKAYFGEAYLQEYLDKKESISGIYEAHFIGRVQGNKIKKIVANFDCIQSVGSIKHLAVINKEASILSKNQSVYLQVNISKDPHKSGFDLEELKKNISEYRSSFDYVSIDGIMAITKYYKVKEDVRGDYKLMKILCDELSSSLNKTLELSIGMSSDYDIAIEEGATVVRIGSLLFGERKG